MTDQIKYSMCDIYSHMDGVLISKTQNPLTYAELNQIYLNYRHSGKKKEFIFRPKAGCVYITTSQIIDGYHYFLHENHNIENIVIKMHTSLEMVKREYFFGKSFIVVHYNKPREITPLNIIEHRINKRNSVFRDLFYGGQDHEYCNLEIDMEYLEELQKKYNADK